MKWFIALIMSLFLSGIAICDVWVHPIYTRIGLIPIENQMKAFWRVAILVDPAKAEDFSGVIFSHGNRQTMDFVRGKSIFNRKFFKFRLLIPDVYLNGPAFFSTKYRLELCSGAGGTDCNPLILNNNPSYNDQGAVLNNELLMVYDYTNGQGVVSKGTFIGIDKQSTQSMIKIINDFVKNAPPGYTIAKFEIWICLSELTDGNGPSHNGEVKLTFYPYGYDTIININTECNS